MNTQSDHELAVKIARLLDQRVSEMDAQTAAKLLDARKVALAHFDQQRSQVWVPVWAGGAMARVAESHFYNSRILAATIAFVVAFACALVWQSYTQSSNELAEVDASLLTDDLPISAYLDRGFDSWLKRHVP